MPNGLSFNITTEDGYDLQVMTTSQGRQIVEITKHRLSMEDFKDLHSSFDKVRWIRNKDLDTGFLVGEVNVGENIRLSFFGASNTIREEVEHLIKEEAYA